MRYNKYKQLDSSEKNVKNIIDGRLSLQSTRRTISQYNLPVNENQYSFKYFKSPEFGQIFNKWDETKRKKFLFELAGTYSDIVEEKYIVLVTE